MLLLRTQDVDGLEAQVQKLKGEKLLLEAEKQQQQQKQQLEQKEQKEQKEQQAKQEGKATKHAEGGGGGGGSPLKEKEGGAEAAIATALKAQVSELQDQLSDLTRQLEEAIKQKELEGLRATRAMEAEQTTAASVLSLSAALGAAQEASEREASERAEDWQAVAKAHAGALEQAKADADAKVRPLCLFSGCRCVCVVYICCVFVLAPFHSPLQPSSSLA
jgi:hypothetical protein